MFPKSRRSYNGDQRAERLEKMGIEMAAFIVAYLACVGCFILLLLILTQRIFIVRYGKPPDFRLMRGGVTDFIPLKDCLSILAPRSTLHGKPFLVI